MEISRGYTKKLRKKVELEKKIDVFNMGYRLFLENPIIPDNTGNVNVGESHHQVLAIKAIHYTPMSWDSVRKIL